MHSNISDNEIKSILIKYGDSVIKTAYMYLKDRYLAEDIYQEVFLKVLSKYPGFDDPVKEKAWVIKITRNLCKDYIKTSWFRRVSTRDDISNCGDETNLKVPETAEPEKSYIANEESKIIYKLVTDLPLKYREVIILYYYHGFSTPQISKLLGKGESNIRNRLFRARKLVEESMKSRNML